MLKLKELLIHEVKTNPSLTDKIRGDLLGECDLYHEFSLLQRYCRYEQTPQKCLCTDVRNCCFYPQLWFLDFWFPFCTDDVPQRQRKAF